MDPTTIILGEVVTEKAMRLKGQNTYTLRIHPNASKIDVKNALRRYFGVDPVSVRIVKVQPKSRLIARGRSIQKRDTVKRAVVKLAPKSKPLDLATFQTN